MNIKQDINMTRKPADIETKYRLQELNPTIQDVDELKEQVVADNYLSATSTQPVQNKVITEALKSKVNRDGNKKLTTNDFNDFYKNKLDGIEENANKYVLPTATGERLGGVRVDNKTISANNGTVSMAIPIGTVFFSVNNFDPSTIFGGTWLAIGSISLNEVVYAYKKVSEEVTE